MRKQEFERAWKKWLSKSSEEGKKHSRSVFKTVQETIPELSYATKEMVATYVMGYVDGRESRKKRKGK